MLWTILVILLVGCWESSDMIVLIYNLIARRRV